jgi:hypothetical protein
VGPFRVPHAQRRAPQAGNSSMAERSAAPDIGIDGRDLAVVTHVSRFKQLSSNQIRELLFPSNSSPAPHQRALERLLKRGYLHRVERRSVGGKHGGSGQFVYSLGNRGFYMFNSGRYSPLRAINYHSLAIADAYIELVRLERAEALSIVGYSTEPDCHRKVGGVELRPDMAVELGKAGHPNYVVWAELDLGTESQRRIAEKFERYYKAYQNADTSELPVFPRIVFVAVDDIRERELQWLLSQGPSEAQALFEITTMAKLSSLFI